MTASGEDPRDTLRRIHPGECGTPNGYQQISRARSALREMGVPEEELPEYDPACKEAWARYVTTRRDKGGQLGLPPGPPRAQAEHGTVQRWRLHVKERRELRAQGVPDNELPPICEECRDARRQYNADRRQRPKRGKRRRGKVTHIRRSISTEPAPHGTPEALKQHRRERRRLRAKGVPERNLPPICSKCQAEAIRVRVLGRVNRARRATGG